MLRPNNHFSVTNPLHRISSLMILFFFITLSFFACSNAAGGNEGYAIGGRGPGGGTIFYYDEDGFEMIDTAEICYYLEVSPAFTEEYPWASTGKTNFNTGATETAIGTGRYNTYLILADSADPEAPAAKACAEYRGGGKSDWFLPSFDELEELRKKKDFINIPYGDYWPSSEISSGGTFYILFALDGYLQMVNSKSKSESIKVRAVRAF